MKRFLIVSAVSLMAAAPVLAQDENDNASAYATCAACHLPDGVGVPGAFPPIRNRAAAIAALEGGRAYLIAVVSYGLMGTIVVDDVQYFGVMAGNAGLLDAEGIAAALNYLVFELNDDEAVGIEPFTTAEVEAAQAGFSLKSPAGGGQLREKLAAEHGDQWP